MPDHEIVMLAALIADGSLTERTPRFCFGPDSPVLDEVEEARRRFRICGCKPRTRTSAQPRSAPIAAPRATRSASCAICTASGGCAPPRSSSPTPSSVSTTSRLERFLAVIYACDGHAYASDRLHQIGYSTISERLAFDVQHLLLRLGIVSRIRTLRREVYEGTDKVAREVLITGQEGLATFCSRVRVCGKSAQLARVVAGLRRVGYGTNVDTVPPAVWSAVLEAKRCSLLGRRQRRHEPPAQPQLARWHARPLTPAHRRARAGDRRRRVLQALAHIGSVVGRGRLDRADRRAGDLRHHRARRSQLRRRRRRRPQQRAGHQHRRERRAEQGQPAPGRPVQPRDVRGRARAALHRVAGLDQGRRPAQGPAARRGEVEARAARRERVRRGAALRRRLLGHRDPRRARQGPAAAPAAWPSTAASA